MKGEFSIKRLAVLFLSILLLIYSGCSPQHPDSSRKPAPGCAELASAVLAACGRETSGVQDLAHRLDSGGLSAYLTGFYGLSEGDWDDCAVYLSASSAEAFEIAILRLTGQADPQAVLDGLEAYRIRRQGDFTGYAPEQAALVENGCAVLSAGEEYAALLICEDSAAARDAFYTALEQNTPATPSPAPSSVPVHSGRIPYTDPGIDDMSIYDTSAILAAWESGDTSSLSDYDRTIYLRAEEVLTQVLSDSMDALERETVIYHWLTSNVSYDQDHYSLFQTVSRDSYTPYNPLTEGKGVCLGFATTFQLLMDMAEVECITVVGAAFECREDHAWNMVRLDGAWYCVDPTWDTGNTVWRYFNVTSDYMAQTDHQWDYASVPEATGP